MSLSIIETPALWKFCRISAFHVELKNRTRPIEPKPQKPRKHKKTMFLKDIWQNTIDISWNLELELVQFTESCNRSTSRGSSPPTASRCWALWPAHIGNPRVWRPGGMSEIQKEKKHPFFHHLRCFMVPSRCLRHWQERFRYKTCRFSRWMLMLRRILNGRRFGTTVDGWNPAPVEVGSLSHYL